MKNRRWLLLSIAWWLAGPGAAALGAASLSLPEGDLLPALPEAAEAEAEPPVPEAAEVEALEPEAAPSQAREEDPMVEALLEEVRTIDEAEAVAGAADEEAPAGGDDGFELVDLLQVAFYLCVICAIIILLAYVARKLGRRTPLLAGQDLGQVLGRVYLAPRASLHFVRTGGKVLVIGMSGQDMRLIAELDGAAFEDVSDAAAEGGSEKPQNSFISELKASAAAMHRLNHEEPGQAATVEDVEIESLRGDLQRLQRYLRESGHDVEH